MRKSKIVLLMAALLACVMLLSSCGFGGTVKFEKIVDGSLYKDQDPAYATSSVVADMKDAEYKTSVGKLVYFVGEADVDDVKYEKHMVYDMVANKTVYTVTETKTTEITISLYETGTENEVFYFTVGTVTYEMDGENVNRNKFTTKTELYNAAGAAVASAAYPAQVTATYDLIRFDGKVYRAAEDGTIAYAFDFSPLAKMPSISYATEEYYYDFSNRGAVVVYDKTLALVSYIQLASFEKARALVTLENGDVFVQYMVEEDPYAEDYDVIEVDDGEVAKYSYYSVIIDAKKGTAKEVDLDYVIAESITPDSEDWAEGMGLNNEMGNFVAACPIVDKRINEADSAVVLGTIANNGSFKQLAAFTDTALEGFYLVGENRWIVSTATTRYLVDEKGEVVGELYNVQNSNDDYYMADGKLYNKADLTMAYDYTAANLKFKKSFDNCILFENLDGELIAYAKGSATTLINKDNKDKITYTEELYLDSEVFVLKDSTEEGKIKYQVYNAAGTNILTLNVLEGFSASIVCSYEGVAIIRNYVVDENVPTVNFLRLG